MALLSAGSAASFCRFQFTHGDAGFANHRLCSDCPCVLSGAQLHVGATGGAEAKGKWAICTFSGSSFLANKGWPCGILCHMCKRSWLLMGWSGDGAPPKPKPYEIHSSTSPPTVSVRTTCGGPPQPSWHLPWWGMAEPLAPNVFFPSCHISCSLASVRRGCKSSPIGQETFESSDQPDQLSPPPRS